MKLVGQSSNGRRRVRQKADGRRTDEVRGLQMEAGGVLPCYVRPHAPNACVPSGVGVSRMKRPLRSEETRPLWVRRLRW